MKKILALLTLVIMLTGCVSSALAKGAYPHEMLSFPTTGPEFDPVNYYSSKVIGFYEANITYDEITRPFYAYYPEGLIETCPVVFMTVPAGYDAYEFIVDAGWKQLSDENGIVLAIMTAETWTEDDIKYVEAVGTFFGNRPFISNRQKEHYMAAYDEASAGAKYVLQTPTHFSALLTVNTTGLTEEECAAFADADSGFFSFEDNSPQKLNEIIWPAWIVAEEKTADIDMMIEYLKAASRTVADAVPCDLAENTVYYAADESRFSGREFKPVAGVYYTEMKSGSTINYRFSSTVWENMFDCIRRYQSFGEVSYFLNPEDEGTGYTRHDALVYGGDYVDSDGITHSGDYYSRYWLTYIPESARDQNNIPVVFAFHGNGSSCYEAGEKHGWRKVADEHGFILVLPQGSIAFSTEIKYTNGVPYYTSYNNWSRKATATRPNDLLFTDYLYKWAKTEFEYADRLDFSRCFAGGFSAGSMWSYTLAAYRPAYFAAIVPVCGITVPNESADASVDVPIFNAMGQMDSTIKGGFSTDNGKNVFNYYLKRYGLTEKGDLNRNWSDFTFLVPDAVCTEKSGFMNVYRFETESGYPMFTGVEIVGMRHASIPSFLEYFWQEGMSHYTRDPETKVLYYDGQVVDTVVNKALAESKQ